MADSIPETLLKTVQVAKAAALKEDNDPRALTLTKRKAFFGGEQVGQNLEYWNGLKPTDSTAFEGFKRRIVVLNIITPALNRFTGHILARDPEWVASVEDKPLPPDDERVAALARWHKGEGKVHRRLKEADRMMRWGGKSYLYLYTPDVIRELMGGELKRDAADLPAALRRVRLEALDMTQAGSLERDGYTVAYWRAYSVTVDGKTQNRLEVHTRDFIGVYLEEGDKLTLVADLGENPRPNPLYDKADPLTFRSLIFELERDGGSQVDALWDAQNSVNVAGSNIRRNNDLGAWRQMWTANAARPRDDEGNETSYTQGPAVVMDLRAGYIPGVNGEPLLNSSGDPIIHPVSVGVFDPVNSQPMREDGEWFERKALGMVNQLWTLEGEGQISGESKKQSRIAFDRALPGESEPAAAALAWVIETADRYAQWIQGADTAVDPLEVEPRLFLDVAKVDLETLKQLDLMHTAGKVSLETLLEALPGVDDVPKELERLEADRASNPTALNALRELGWDAADWLKALQSIGFPISPEAITRAEELAAAGAEALEGGEDGGDREAV